MEVLVTRRWPLVFSLALVPLACGGDDGAETCDAEPSCDGTTAVRCVDGKEVRWACATGAGCSTREVGGEDDAVCLALPQESCTPGDATQCRGDGAARTCNDDLSRVELYDCDGTSPPAPGCEVCGS